MKIYVAQPRTNRILIDVDPNSTLISIKEKLIREHKFLDGEYNFIHNGKFLSIHSHFSQLAEGSVLMIFIKNPFDPSTPKIEVDADYIYNHPEEAQELAEILDNAAPEIIILNEMVPNVPEQVLLTAMSLLGSYARPNPPRTPDFDAILMELSDKQRQDFTTVCQTCPSIDRDIVLQTFIACDHDPQNTIACLM